jgi:hypothetical protein
MDSELASLFVAHSTKKLEQMTGHVEICLSKLGDELVWARGGSNENSVANLVLHLQGNVRQWIIHGIGGAPDVRERPHEFSTANGRTAKELGEGLREIMDEAMRIIAGLSAERLVERIKPQDAVVSVVEAVYQVVGHFQQHAGQIIYATKQITGEDLGFYRPPTKPANAV